MEDFTADEEDIILLASMNMLLVSCAFLMQQNQRRRRWWVDPINRPRDLEGEYATLYRHISEKGHDHFYVYTRLKKNQFDALLLQLRPRLIRKSPREPICPEMRLAMTLKYLAHGQSIRTLAWGFRVGKSTARKIILETCEVIWAELSEMYVRVPQGNEWLKIADDFWRLWQFPNCLGAIDGKHVAIEAPRRSGSQWYCYKNFHSIVLLAAADAHYRFIWVDCGGHGSRSDGGLLAESGFGDALISGTLDLPSQPLPGTNNVMPCWFVADAAFPLKTHIQRPYPGRNLSLEKDIYNYRLSRARRIIENSFGILCARSRILRSKLHGYPKNVSTIVLPTVAMHNLIMSWNGPRHSRYCPENFVDTERDGQVISGGWRDVLGTIPHRNVGRIGANNPSRSAIALRDQVKDFLCTQGAVEWQYRIINRGRE